MSDADNSSFPDFGKFVPGFDFLQNLAKQAASHSAQSSPQLPGLGSWVAPTLNVEDLDKRIQELKAVQFWLDQNAMALKATIQALEVQKMTLVTLKGMNFNMGDIANAFKLKVPEHGAGAAERPAEKSKTFAGLEVPPASFQSTAADAAQAKAQAENVNPAGAAGAAGGVVDPLQWWGALTQQFQTIAADAMKDVAQKSALDSTQNLAQEAIKTATSGVHSAMNNALRSSQAWPSPMAAKPAAAPKAASRAKPKVAKAAKTVKPAPARKAARKTAR